MLPGPARILPLLLLVTLPLFCSDTPRIYIANDDHTDYLWSGSVADYRAAFGNMLKYYLDRVDATENQPTDQQAASIATAACGYGSTSAAGLRTLRG
jgi:hypothetical protein